MIGISNMQLHQKFKHFPLHDEIANKTLDFIKQYSFLYNRSIATLVPLAQLGLYEAVPEIRLACAEINLIPNFVAVHALHRQSESSPHYDSVTPQTRINIPLLNCVGSKTEFYEDPKSKIFLNPHNPSVAYTAESADQLTKIDEVEVDYATILRVSALHSVVLGPNVPRFTLTIGFEDNGADLFGSQLNWLKANGYC